MSLDSATLENLLPWAKERAAADRVALLRSAVAALKAALPVWSAAQAGDARLQKAHRAAEVWCKNPQSEFAEACAGVAMEAASAAEEAGEGPPAAVARAAQHLGEAVMAADAEDLDEVAERVANAVRELAQALEPAALRAAIPSLPGGAPAAKAAPAEKAAPAAKAASSEKAASGERPVPAPATKTASGEQALRRARPDQTERAQPSDGEAHKLLFALREAERHLVPEHLDLPDHVLLLSLEEREAALSAVKAGNKPPQDLRELVARRRKEQTRDLEPAPAAPAARTKTIGDEAPARPSSGRAAAPEPAVEDEPEPDEHAASPVEDGALVRDRARYADDAAASAALLPVERRDPPVPDPDLGVRLIGALWAAVFGLAAFALYQAAFSRELTEAVENARLRLLLQAAAVGLPGYPALLGLLALLTGRQPQALNPLALPMEPWWWSTLWTMSLREVQSMLVRPMAYMAMFMYLSVNGVLFAMLLDYYGGEMSLGRDMELTAAYWVTQNWVTWLTLIIICPAITMRLLAEEAQVGTLESLLTAPITHVQVVLSKFAGALSFFLLLLLLTGGYMAIVAGFSPEWEWGPVLGGYLGMLLVGSLFLSLGLFTSSLTRSQVVAFVLAVAGCMLIWLAPQFLTDKVETEGLRAALKHVNLSQQQEELAKGLVHWRSLVFYASSTLFFLFMSVRGVESHTWR